MSQTNTVLYCMASAKIEMEVNPDGLWIMWWQPEKEIDCIIQNIESVKEASVRNLRWCFGGVVYSNYSYLCRSCFTVMALARQEILYIGLWMETMMGTGSHHSYMRKLGFGAIEWKHLYWSVGRIYDWDSELEPMIGNYYVSQWMETM